MKDIKVRIQSHADCCHGDIKEIATLKRKIQRMGLVLSRHAEENVLTKYEASIGIRDRKPVAKRKLHMVVIRISASEELMESKPCANCIKLLREYGIRKITYSTGGELVTESLATMVGQPSVGYRSVDRAISILDSMLDSS